MRKIIITVLLAAIFSLRGGQSVFANFEKIDPQNNKFGIHLTTADETDLQDAANLVNSTGGDWGYVTLVIGERDKSTEKWQKVFDNLRELHLIPIIRLSTAFENGSWRQPNIGEAVDWANFLNSLNWVTKNRYIILFNEPNHSNEWGGKIDPEGYGKIATEFAGKLKEKNQDFFVMLAGLDAAAPHKLPSHEDEEVFLRRMFSAFPNGTAEFESLFDGLASHSYPNHGFVGSPYDQGRNSIHTYLWEKNLLQKLGINKDLPVFITETGWPHNEGLSPDPAFYKSEKVADNFRLLYNQLAGDSKVIAITPFILNYQGEPFDHFSWRKLNSSTDFYSQYQEVQRLTKIKGSPVQEEQITISNSFPKKLIEESAYEMTLLLKNSGQSILSQKDGYKLELTDWGKEGKLEHFFTDLVDRIKPFKEDGASLYLKTGSQTGHYSASLIVTKNGKPISQKIPWSFEVVPSLGIEFRVSLALKRITEGNDFKVLIYNNKDEVIFEKTNVSVKNGRGQIKKVHNLALDGKYRIVILKPYYLPRQQILVIEQNNQIDFGKMLPLDFNKDGKFSSSDFWTTLFNPDFRKLFWPFGP